MEKSGKLIVKARAGRMVQLESLYKSQSITIRGEFETCPATHEQMSVEHRRGHVDRKV